jgi:aryl-phospho-beta-D-glucosidase BglC (GH1 family)
VVFLTTAKQPWITPSLFDNTGNADIVDEWTFAQFQDRNVAQARLMTHWNTWITEADFQSIARAGYVFVSARYHTLRTERMHLVFFFKRLNHVRIPIGYWAYEVGPGEPYIQGQHQFLQKAVGWAKKYNLKVIVDLHGVPGSQNGYEWGPVVHFSTLWSDILPIPHQVR